MRGRIAIGALAYACVLVFSAPVFGAVGDYLGKPVVSVRLTIEGRDTTEAALMQLVETRVGRPLTMTEVRETLTHLFSLGRFDDVRVDAVAASAASASGTVNPVTGAAASPAARPTGGTTGGTGSGPLAGVALTYELSPIHPVASIVFDGNLRGPGIDIGQLRRAVVDRYGSSPRLLRAADMARTVADTLRDRGYLHATVKPSARLEHAPERAKLVFTVDPGPRTLVGSISLAGVLTLTREQLLKELDVEPGAPYEGAALAARVDRLVASIRRRGYYEASVVPAVHLVDDDRVANLTFSVNAGSRVRVVFSGDPVPSDRRADLVPIEREGSVEEDVLEDASNRIEEELKGQGYRDARAPHTREETDGELVITFTVHRGALYRTERVEISGNASVPLGELQPVLRLREGQMFSDGRLDADIAAIEDVYHRRGFPAAKAQPDIEIVTPARAPSQGLAPGSPAGSAPGSGQAAPQDLPQGVAQAAVQPMVQPGAQPEAQTAVQAAVQGAVQAAVRVRIAIREGVRTVVGPIRIVGNQSIPVDTLRGHLGLRQGGPYFDAQLRADADAIQSVYVGQGYQNATVDAVPNFTLDRTEVDPIFTVREGPRLLVDHVLIVGNVRTDTKTIEHELQFKPGDPVSPATVNESQRRLAALGLFRRVRITQVRHGEETRRDLLVTVEEAPATTIGYGGGFEVRLRVVRPEDVAVATEKLELAPRASFEIGRRNLFGKNRSANLFTSVSLYPKDSPVFAGQSNASTDDGYGFAEYRVIGTFREPRLFDTAADAFITATLEQQIRSSFNFARRGINAEITRRVTRSISVSGSYQIQRTQVFDEIADISDQHLIDRLFPQVRLSSFSTSGIRDTRNDPVDPSGGAYFSVNGQLAARRIGSEVGFAKTFMTAQLFRVVPHTKRLVLAGSARLGLADAFPRTVAGTSGADTVVEDLPASERFFAGGDSTVRGYALDTLGAPGTKDQDGFPVGGNALVIFNAEARIPVWGGLGIVGFLDTGNVFAHPTDLDLGALKTAVGFGVRYKSPVGPIRIDLGFKLRRDELAPGVREGLTALHISFGQAF